MYSPPFHRRILPWIFVITFLVAAPTLIFYTAGYRWNPKKDKLERNGTLILDSRPSDANVYLNNQLVGKTTPVTLQDVPPGRYLVRVSKSGYRDWQKTLDVRPERVTFADDVTLWKISEPKLVSSITPVKLQAAVGEKSLVMAYAQTTDTAVALWTNKDGVQSPARLPASAESVASLDWSDTAQALVAKAVSGQSESAWLITPGASYEPLGIPEGVVRWTAERLIDALGGETLTIHLRTAEVSRQALPPPIVDQDDDIALSRLAEDERLTIENVKRSSERFLLPPGAWRISERNGERVLLKDNDRWMMVRLDGADTEMHSVRGEALRPFAERRLLRYLALSQGEAWLWNPDEEPELLLRQSAPIVNAVWYKDGRNAIIADKTSVWALNLDQRDGRLRTTLASFDDIKDIALLDDTLYISATRGDQSGLWALEVE